MVEVEPDPQGEDEPLREEDVRLEDALDDRVEPGDELASGEDD